MKKGAGKAIPSLEGTYEIAARPNVIRSGEASEALWDPIRCVAEVTVCKGTHLAVMGSHERVGEEGKSQGANQRSVHILQPEEVLLLVEQGLLLLRHFYYAYARLREIGYAVARAPYTGGTPGSRPLLALWSREATGKKGWRKTPPQHIVLVVHATEQIPTISEINSLLSSSDSGILRIAAVDDSSDIVFFTMTVRAPSTSGSGTQQADVGVGVCDQAVPLPSTDEA